VTRAAYGVVAALALGLGAGMTISACVKAPAPTSPQKNEITALWTQIRDWRLEAGLPVDPPSADLMSARDSSVRKARAVCAAQPQSQQCADVCDLGDAICDNAERICELAEDLHGDSWAEDKCTSAKASCREAKRRCCACDDRAARGRLRGDDEDREN
jgi:hypothetical protein